MKKPLMAGLSGMQCDWPLGWRALAGLCGVLLLVFVNFQLEGFAAAPAVAQKTTTTLTSSPGSTFHYGQCLFLEVTVASRSSAPPAGETVRLMDGKSVLGTAELESGGWASFGTQALLVGTHSITAVYGGDANFAASTSNAVSEVVSKGATATTLVSSEDPSTLGKPVTLTADARTTAEGCYWPGTVIGAATPTGTVTFKAGGKALGSAALSDGIGSITTSSLSLGSNSITAVYSGDPDCTGSTSSALSQTVADGATPTFTTFSVKSAGTGAMQGTMALGINTAGVVTGAYFDAKGVAHGFLRAANGAISTFDAPGAGRAPGPAKNSIGSPYFQGTVPVAINDSGVTAGTYIDSNYNYHGFVRTAAGAIVPFDVPGDITVSAWWHGMGTRPTSINASGEIAGTYMGAEISGGFVRAANGGMTTFDGPGANGASVLPVAVDSAGEVAGAYLGGNGEVLNGFIRSAGGSITSFSVKGAGGRANPGEMAGTVAVGMNPGGDIAGTYTDANSIRHGFVRTAGAITTFDAPGAGTGWLVGVGGVLAGTAGVGINAAGEVAGAYLDADAVYHGFLRAAGGAITTFDVPGAGAGPLGGTIAFSINAAGSIAGTFIDENYTGHGFVLSPALNATTTRVSSAPNPSLFKEPVTLTAEVEVSSGSSVPPDTDSVTFLDGTTQLGAASLMGGAARFTTTSLPAGTNLIRAVYGGNVGLSLAGSTSNVVSQTVGKASSFAALAAKPNPSSYGQSVTFKATVTGQFGGTPTGTATFSDGKTVLKSVALSGGVANLTIASLASGTHKIAASYAGDANFTASSNSLTQTVK